MADDAASASKEVSGGFWVDLYNELSYVNIALIAGIAIMMYKIIKRWTGEDQDDGPPPDPPLPPMKKQDMTLEHLRKFDGTQEDGRVLVAINGRIFDVTKGKRFYGPGGPYSSFAGHDASRALAMFQTDVVKEEYDDLSDLDSHQMESVREWEEQLAEKYEVIGRLLKPGEEPTNYSDEEDEKDEKSKDD